MMSTLAAALYGLLAIYLAGWAFGQWSGNFAALLFVLSVVTGLFWVFERFVARPRRRAAAARIVEADEKRRAALAAQGITQVDGNLAQARDAALAEPWWVEWTAGLFPVIVVVFLLRSFLFEPFKIPSGSMIPTLTVGDLILVNKYHYGIRLPVVNRKIIANHDPKRGDVVVFRYPVDPRIDYIKRVVGVPGDEVVYTNQTLTVNGRPVPTQPEGEVYDEETMRHAKKFRETLGTVAHGILVDPTRASIYQPMSTFTQHRDACHYSAEGVRCKVPPGHYFMMGDNRDNSLDSRYWGFVPDENIVGRAFMIWLNFSDLGRFGRFD